MRTKSIRALATDYLTDYSTEKKLEFKKENENLRNIEQLFRYLNCSKVFLSNSILGETQITFQKIRYSFKRFICQKHHTLDI